MAAQVLCVDDDPDMAGVTGRFLERSGLSVVTATSAEEALAILDERDVECIVSDYEMPRAPGIEFVRAVREQHPDLPFILFTGRGNEEVASEAISAGVTDYLQKGRGERYRLLANRVKNAIRQYRAEQQLGRTRRKVTRLHESATELMRATTPEEVYDRALAAAETVLEFEDCGVYIVENGEFVPKSHSYRPEEGLPTVDEGVVGATYREGRSFLVEDTEANEVAQFRHPAFRSAVSVPIGEHGVFQAFADESGFFDENDRKLAELLVSHVTAALNRLEYERDLRETNERLRAILENTTALIYAKDREGRYTLVNSRFEETLGRTGEEVIGRTDHDLFDEAHAEALWAHDRRALEHDEPVEVEETVEWGGEEHTYYSVKVPIHDDAGEPTAVCSISTDITRLKRREEQLEAQKERLDEFASVVSHDLRNPLSVAHGYLELVREDVDDDRLDRVERALDRIEAIIEDLLALARAGERIGETEPVDLEAVAHEAWSNVSVNADLVVDGGATVKADRDRLLQLFENLFRNAGEHADPSTVRVGATDDGFYVEDDGPGIPPEKREEVFQPGYTTAEGTGFGLAIVEDIADAHGWRVAVEESTQGGARFVFSGVDVAAVPDGRS